MARSVLGVRDTVTMRAALLALTLVAAALRPAFGKPSLLEKRVDEQKDDTTSSDLPTEFNGVKVPAMKALEGQGFEDSIKEGYWYVHFWPPRSLRSLTPYRFVKHYSPYCQFCTKIAPVWQTLYEFYYVGSSSRFSISDSN